MVARVVFVGAVSILVACGDEAVAPGFAAFHRFGPVRAEVAWYGKAAPLHGRSLRGPDDLAAVGLSDGRGDVPGQHELKILHITDAHVSLADDSPPQSTRMFDAFKGSTNRATHAKTTPKEELVQLFRLASEERVDLIALGGDIVNYPSHGTVTWVLEQLREAAAGVPFIYTAGNHDWHMEGVRPEASYDAQRVPELNSTLRPLFENSVGFRSLHPSQHGEGFSERLLRSPIRGLRTAGAEAGLLYGATKMKGVEVLFVDNSNHQVNAEQLTFLRERLEGSDRDEGPVVLLLHMPLQLPGVSLEPKFMCGHPSWGRATDQNANVESRPPWPEGNLPSTAAFIELVQSHAAPAGRIVALLTGHVHRDFSSPLGIEDAAPLATNLTALVCDARRALPGCELSKVSMDSAGVVVSNTDVMEGSGALQYNTLDGSEGGYRLLTVKMRAPVRWQDIAVDALTPRRGF